MDQKSSGGKGRIAWILLILSLAGNLLQWRSNVNTVSSYQVKTDSLITARVDVEKALDQTRDDLNKYRGINARLDSLLLEANNDIEKQKEHVDRLTRSEKNSRALNAKLQKELEEVKKMRDSYLEKIDELLVENESLKKDKEDLTSTVESLSRNLETTVNSASVLKGEYVKVTALKKKSSGKYTTTAMARRANKMDVCFTVLENNIAKPGEKTVYLRIVEPGGKTMGDRAGTGHSGSFTMKSSGQEIMYSSQGTLQFDNTRQDYCIAYEEAERIFTPGTYLIEVYIDESLSVAASYVLK